MKITQDRMVKNMDIIKELETTRDKLNSLSIDLSKLLPMTIDSKNEETLKADSITKGNKDGKIVLPVLTIAEQTKQDKDISIQSAKIDLVMTDWIKLRYYYKRFAEPRGIGIT